MSAIRIGTARSALATARARKVAGRLGDHALVEVPVGGDDEVASLREALTAGEVDVIVLPLDALPLSEAAGIRRAAIPKRGDARDALCTADGVDLDGLPEGAKVGADTPRRRAQLLAARGDLQVVEVEGDTAAQLARLAAGGDAHLDAVVLPVAELELVGAAPKHVRFDLSDWPTAPGQGALALEVAADAARDVRRRVESLDHRTSRLTATAERCVLHALGAAIDAPVVASAILDDGLLFLTASVYAFDGSSSITSSHAAYPEDTTDPAAELAGRVAAELLELGAGSAPYGGAA